MHTMSEKVFYRAGEAKEYLGISDYLWRQLITAKVITPIIPPGGTYAVYSGEQLNSLSAELKRQAKPVELCS